MIEEGFFIACNLLFLQVLWQKLALVMQTGTV